MGSCNYPFKFNRSWLNDLDFIYWVSMRWPKLTPPSSGYDLDLLKKEVKDQIKEKGTILESESHRLDKDISTLLSCSSFGIISHEEQLCLSQLRTKKEAVGTLPFDLAA